MQGRHERNDRFMEAERAGEQSQPENHPSYHELRIQLLIPSASLLAFHRRPLPSPYQARRWHGRLYFLTYIVSSSHPPLPQLMRQIQKTSTYAGFMMIPKSKRRQTPNLLWLQKSTNYYKVGLGGLGILRTGGHILHLWCLRATTSLEISASSQRTKKSRISGL